MNRRVLAGVLALLAGSSLALSGSGPAQGAGWLHDLREDTAVYQQVAAAKADGYGVFKDADGIACIDQPGEGGMGIHFVNGDLVGDAEVVAVHPEALVYDPTPEGKRLVALEYIVFRKAWRGEHPTGRPELFGERFELVKAGNRYGIPAFFELHVWAWKVNPSGTFEDWNPRVSCP